MACVDCGAVCSGTRCRRCHLSNSQTRKLLYDQSEVILTNGYWYNDNGIMRWKAYHD